MSDKNVVQIKINLPSTSLASLIPEFSSSIAGIWKDALQRPVEISQVFTTPFLSLEIAIPALACRLTDMIGGKVDGVEC